MNDLYTIKVDVDADLINEFSEDLESSLQLVESHIISLEQNDLNVNRLEAIKKIFQELSLNSIKFNLIPLSECVDDIVKVFQVFIEHQFFSSKAAELFLLIIDKILIITEEVEEKQTIDVMETQNITVSLQNILLVHHYNEFNETVDKALNILTQHINCNTQDTDTEDSNSFFFDIFEDEVDAQDDTSRQLDKQSKQTTTTEFYITEAISNPILQAQEVITSVRKNKAITLLADISDRDTFHGDLHTQFLLEIGLAINFMAGEVIEPISFSHGLCLHDIALSSMSNILNKTGKLTDEEFNLVKQHPSIGVSLAEALQLNEDSVNTIKHHHERVNGSGYPANLQGDQISEAGKLTAIIDSYHAIIYERPHKKYTRSALRAISELNASVDSHYDRFWIKQFNLFMKQYWLPINKEKLLNIY